MGKTTWIAAAGALLASAALLSSPAHAVNASVYVQIAPPGPQVEIVPAAPYGQSWVPGHWEWRRHQYLWVPGYFVAARAGYYHAQPQWVQYGNRWGYHSGGWQRGGPPHGRDHGRRDSDRDGIPDRYDRDRDNDGVPNRFDRRPNNPYRN
jgi:hypothetical protein